MSNQILNGKISDMALHVAVARKIGLMVKDL